MSYANYYTNATDYLENDKIVKLLNLPIRPLQLMKLKRLHPKNENETDDAWLNRILPLAQEMIKKGEIYTALEIMVEPIPFYIEDIVLTDCWQIAKQMLLDYPRLPNEPDLTWLERLYLQIVI
jgi:hypothetical protein